MLRSVHDVSAIKSESIHFCRSLESNQCGSDDKRLQNVWLSSQPIYPKSLGILSYKLYKYF